MRASFTLVTGNGEKRVNVSRVSRQDRSEQLESVMALVIVAAWPRGTAWPHDLDFEFISVISLRRSKTYLEIDR